MGKARALVNKLKRRQKSVRMDHNGFDRRDKQDQSEEVLFKSKGFRPMRSVQRRLDRNFGVDSVGQEPLLSKRVNASTVARYDFGVSDFGTRVTLAAGLIEAIGIQPNDVIKFLEGALKGQYLKVVSLEDSTHLRLEDAASLNYAGVAEKTSITCLADSAGSLDGKYFTIKSANDATSYYVWLDVDAGGNDPLASGTAIPVSISSNDSAEDVAAAVAAALEANADFTAYTNSAEVVVINAAVGPSTDAADSDTGFSISVLTQGAAANPTVSESDVMVRCQLSDIKKSYV